MSATLLITSNDLSDEDIQDLTYELCTTLNRESDNIRATTPASSNTVGTKGDAIGIGTIILTLVGSGGVVVSLVNVLRAYIDRGKRLKIVIKGKNGESVEVDEANLAPDELEHTIKLIGKVLGAYK